MGFHFPLEGLLRVRRLLEEQSERRLQESLMRIGALEHSLDEATRWSQQTARLCAANQRLPAVEAQFIDRILRRTAEAMAACRHQLQSEQERASQLRAAYLRARREREMVSTLREQALERWEREQARRTQAEMDDRYLGKLVYGRTQAHAGEEVAP
jgi:flagellar export protein FliJ